MTNFCLEIRIFLKFPEKLKFFGNLPWKNRIFLVKLPEEIEIFLEFACKNRIFFYPDPRPPRFQTRLTPLIEYKCRLEAGQFQSASIISAFLMYVLIVLTEFRSASVNILLYAILTNVTRNKTSENPFEFSVPNSIEQGRLYSEAQKGKISLYSEIFHLFIHPFIYSSIHTYIHRYSHLFIYSSILSSSHSSINLSIHSSVRPSTHPSVHPIIHQSIHTSLHSSIHLSSHQSIEPCSSSIGSAAIKQSAASFPEPGSV